MTNEENEFGVIEIELNRLLDGAKTLKDNIQQYATSSEQLTSGKEAFTSGADALTDQLATAGKQLSEAANQLQPIGTTQIIDALNKLESNLVSIATEIENSLARLSTAASSVELVGEKLKTTTSSLEDNINALEQNIKTLALTQTNVLLDFMKNFLEHVDSKFEKFEENTSLSDKSNNDSQRLRHKELLEAIELSAPKGLFRKKAK